MTDERLFRVGVLRSIVYIGSSCARCKQSMPKFTLIGFRIGIGQPTMVWHFGCQPPDAVLATGALPDMTDVRELHEALSGVLRGDAAFKLADTMRDLQAHKTRAVLETMHAELGVLLYENEDIRALGEQLRADLGIGPR